MQFGLTESQQILKDNARKFFAGECPMAEVRRMIESGKTFDRTLWTKMAEQGFTGIIFPEEYGGLGLGKVELILLMEEMGYALVPGPFFSTVALAGAVIDACGSPEQKKKYLGPICSGEACATVALTLDSFPHPEGGGSNVKFADGKLTGDVLFVPDAQDARFVVVVTSSGAVVLDFGDGATGAVPMTGMDSVRPLYRVGLGSAGNVPTEKLSNTQGWRPALDLATVALAAEMTGGMQRVLDLTVQYAKTRKQFGKPIGSFQAVQHQCADMYLETESSRSAAYYAAWALEENAPDAATAVSVAKMYASDASRTVGNRGIQVHGGMGFTWENDLHLYYRHAKASETMLGDATFHRERIARLVVDGVKDTYHGDTEARRKLGAQG